MYEDQTNLLIPIAARKYAHIFSMVFSFFFMPMNETPDQKDPLLVLMHLFEVSMSRRYAELIVVLEPVLPKPKGLNLSPLQPESTLTFSAWCSAFALCQRMLSRLLQITDN